MGLSGNTLLLVPLSAFDLIFSKMAKWLTSRFPFKMLISLELIYTVLALQLSPTIRCESMWFCVYLILLIFSWRQCTLYRKQSGMCWNRRQLPKHQNSFQAPFMWKGRCSGSGLAGWAGLLTFHLLDTPAAPNESLSLCNRWTRRISLPEWATCTPDPTSESSYY